METVDGGNFSKTYIENIWNCDDNKSNREKYSQELCDYLSKKFKISAPKVVVTDQPQAHRMNNGRLKSKVYGRYNPTTMTIKIYNTTAVRHSVIGIKTFTDTLLHEYMHHYDIYYLKIKSIHSADFYKRINDLKNKLIK